MKVRESGMPDEAYWDTFFDPDGVIERLGCVANSSDRIVEFGSGYGTFTLAAARRTYGTVHALEIEPDLVELLRAKAQALGLRNVNAIRRDFLEEGSGLADGSVDHAMAFNILHLEQPMVLLAEAHRVLASGGTLSIVHWKVDPATPRGPPMAMRPTPGQCRAWAEQCGFSFVRAEDLSPLCPHHWGLLLRRTSAA